MCAVAAGAARRGGAGAADRVRQPRQPDAGAHPRPRQGDRGASALGASRWRVVQQLLTEGLVLGLGGGITGFAAAYYGVELLKVAFGSAAADRKLWWMAGCCCSPPRSRSPPGCSAAFAPAWQLTGRDANDALKSGPGRGNSSSGDGRIRNLLVVSEVALALMLLIGAGLLMRSLSGLRAVDPGFDPSNVLTATSIFRRRNTRRRSCATSSSIARSQNCGPCPAWNRRRGSIASRCRAGRRSTSPSKASRR